MRRLANSALACAAALAALSGAACKRMPGEVIKPAQMSEILADIHTAEAVVEDNYREYNSDSARLALKQAVFDSHGVTQEQFDTSLVWYAHNIDKYIDVYDNTIKILEKRSQAAGSLMANEAMALGGDSVDIWPASRYVLINSRMPSPILAFDIDDTDSEPGDIYTFRAKAPKGTGLSAQWTIVAEYDDGYADVVGTSVSIPLSNTTQITLATDTARTIRNIRGGMQIVGNSLPADLWLDSISLIRKRYAPELYQERYRVRQYKQY